MTDRVRLRNVEEADLAAFFEHQREPAAIEMAAFPPREIDAFMAHWGKILADPTVIARTVLVESAVAGNVVCWKRKESDLSAIGWAGAIGAAALLPAHWRVLLRLLQPGRFTPT